MSSKAQQGQAVVESLAGLALLGLLGTAIISVGRLQWHGMEAAHAARVQAFRYAVGDRSDDGGRGLSDTRQGASANAGPVRTHVARAAHAADFPGPGGARVAALRKELDVEDRGMVRADAAVRVYPHRQHGDGRVLRRHAAILADAGHATDDPHAQERIASSRTAWRDAARVSHAPARRAKTALQRIDRAWGRPTPDLDWLMPWSDLVPADRLDRAAKTAGRLP